MTDFFRSIGEKLLVGIIGSALGYLARTIIDLLKKQRRTRAIIDFFGIKRQETIYIIHSSVFDQERKAYDFPSCDTRSYRLVARLLESVDMKEDENFHILPDFDSFGSEGSLKSEIVRCNMVLIGSPKRNKVTSEILKRLPPTIRYRMEFDEEADRNRLYDNTRGTELLGTREIAKEPSPSAGHDFGLILAVPNPYNLERTVIFLSGIHGAGTIGASLFISSVNNISELLRRRKDKLIQEVIVAKYQDDHEKVEEVSLA